MERINRAREQGWRNVLGSGGSGVKVGSRCRNVVESVPPTFDYMKWSSLFRKVCSWRSTLGAVHYYSVDNLRHTVTAPPWPFGDYVQFSFLIFPKFLNLFSFCQ